MYDTWWFIILDLEPTICWLHYTRPVRKVSSHFEYLENRLHSLDATRQPVRGDLTVHPEESLSHGACKLAVRRRWLSLCTVWPSHSQWPSEQISESAAMHLPILQPLCRLFWQNIASPRSVSTPIAQIWLPGTSGFSKLKSLLKVGRFVNVTVTQYTSPVNGVSLLTDQPHGRVAV
jgi:hypothetical protein